MAAEPDVGVDPKAMWGLPWASQNPEIALSSQAEVAHFVGVSSADGVHVPLVPGLTQFTEQLIASGLMQSLFCVQAREPPVDENPPVADVPAEPVPPKEVLPPVVVPASSVCWLIVAV